MPDRHDDQGRPASAAPRGRGQALVLFALFLLVMLGASALAIDYANWLLTDRRLQNIADHAALAGASQFQERFTQANCGTNPGLTQCGNARAQAWASISQDLALGLDNATIGCLAAQDTPLVGWTNANQVAGCGDHAFGHRIWVATPPPNNTSYTEVGGRYSLNYGIVWARVDEPTSSYLARVFGIGARDRIGWATAGPLPTDFALQIFCRNFIPPEDGACGGSGQSALVIDGQGGINLVRGDIGSNASLKVTATNGGGVVTQSGNVFVVEGSCSQNLWRCPNGPPSLGGISDGYNGKNAFFMPPQPVPHYQSPLDGVTVADRDCIGAGPNDLCVPYRGSYVGSPDQPGDWACTADPADLTKPLCGIPHDYFTTNGAPVNGTVRCDARQPEPDGFLDPITNHYHMHPSEDLGNSAFLGHTAGPKDIYRNLADSATPMVADTTPSSWVYSKDGDSTTYRAKLSAPPGLPDPGLDYFRWTPFRTINNGDLDTTTGGEAVTIAVEVDEQRLVGGTLQWVQVSGAVDSVTLTSGATLPLTPREIPIDASFIQNYYAVSVKFTVTTHKNNGANASLNRGAGISWSELETTNLQPALPPMIPPGYYHEIIVPDNSCAILDPTAAYSSLKLYQKAGIYRFGSGNDSQINIGAGSFLIGDGVTLVFNPEFPDPTGGRGIVIGARGALVLNTMRVPSASPAPCTPTEPEPGWPNPGDTYNPSTPLPALPYSSICAAWAVDSGSGVGVRSGQMLWTSVDPITGNRVPYCADPSASPCIARQLYASGGLPEHYRGITFFFTPAAWPPSDITRRFQMNGGGACTGTEPGIAFRGVLYAPYDDVIITGGSNFNTVGQVLAWTAKFNGACAALDLDYPYESEPAPPYLLEPGLGQ